MASTSIRSISRISPSSLRSFAAKSKTAARYFAGGPAATPPPTRRFSSFSRLPEELGCCGGSLLPLHSAVAAARLTSRLSLTSRNCRALSQGNLKVVQSGGCPYQLPIGLQSKIGLSAPR